jgi:cytochrome c oxidase subunit I+III
LSDDHGYHHGPHDWSHGAPHNSWAPIVISIGSGVFLFFFAKAFTMNEGMNGYIYDSAPLPLAIAGLAIIFAGLISWWKQDFSFDGSYEPQATHGSAPFSNVDIRKVGMWVFLMSEMMIFSSLFSTYIRYRTSIVSCYSLEGTVVEPGTACWLPASYFIAKGGEHANSTLGFMPDALVPGAINTFALIISSYTIVMALKTAKRTDLEHAERSIKVRNYLGATFCLATLFLVMKMVEWFIGFHIGPFEAPSLLSDQFTIHNDAYTYNYGHGAEAGAMTVDIRMAASAFYLTTGTHGVHVFAGIVGLGYMVVKAHKGGYGPGNAVSIEYFGLYWHFVDLAWVAVFPAFYLY